MTTETTQLRTTLLGDVHRAGCADLTTGMTWLWQGRNALSGDRPCSTCLPDGLPDMERWKPTEEEAEKLRAIVGDDKEKRQPRIDKQEWTFTLTGDCIYCGKPAKRSRTFSAKSSEDASAQADAAMGAGIWHRKCGLC